MSVSNRNSGIHAQAHKKCAIKMKERKKMTGAYNIFDYRKEFIRRVRKTRVMDIKRLQVNDSSYIEGTICLVNE